MKICSVDGCGKRRDAKGFCPSHYNRWKRHGDPLAGHAFYGESTRWMLDHLEYDGDNCLIWPFCKTTYGYGTIGIDGKTELAHRVILTITQGPPQSDDQEVRHICGQGHNGCVNPKHLRWGTRFENVMDKVEHGTMLRGENHVSSKLTERDVINIRSLLANGILQREIAVKYGVVRHTIGGIKLGKRWGWLQ